MLRANRTTLQLDTRARTYIIATIIGIISGTFVWALLGDSVGGMLGTYDVINLKIIFEVWFLAPIIGLSFYRALFPCGRPHPIQETYKAGV